MNRGLIGALSTSAAIALLVGCGASQTPIGAPGAMPQVREVPQKAARQDRMYFSSRADGIARRSPATSSYEVLHRFGRQAKLAHAHGGAWPWTDLVDVNGAMYGTTKAGGAPKCNWGCGTVYSISKTGEKKTLYRFHGSDGLYPLAGLLDVNGTLYGTTYYGGSSGAGVVFSLSTTGTETVLYSFKGGSDGANPRGDLVNVNGALYGTTEQGGGSGCSSGSSHGCGIVYSITPSGQETVLYRFQEYSEGAHPHAGLIPVNGALYGTTRDGGAHDCGTVFKVTTSGSETLLHSFNCRSDGANLWAPLIAVKGMLYGTTENNQSKHGDGTVFKMTTEGSIKVLHYFAGGQDGAVPLGGLVYLNGEFYGTTLSGGSSSCNTPSSDIPGCGTIYSLNASGSEKVLYRFEGGSDGVEPSASLLAKNGILYGTTNQGGGSGCQGYGCGTVFALTP
jgi:uncharacterized repeat protein (TIGR03803 family)